MTAFEKPVVGNFCWIEVNLNHPEKGKGFYSELFGWKSDDMKMPVGEYTMFKVGKNTVAGLLAMPENAKKMGAPSHWLAYVAVSDVDAATKKAEKLGAKVFLEPTTAGPGRLSVIGDPTGALLALWQELKPMGAFVWGEANSLCWMELTTKDPAAATKFYVEMFGWKTEVAPMGDFDYTLLSNGDLQMAGLMPQPKPMVEAKAPSFWTPYFGVENCDESANRAKKLGGEIVMPPTDIPNVGRFAILKDPDGAAFAIIKGEPRS